MKDRIRERTTSDIEQHIAQLRRSQHNMERKLRNEARRIGVEPTFVDDREAMIALASRYKDRHFGNMLGIYLMRERQIVDAAQRLRDAAVEDIRNTVERNRQYLTLSSSCMNEYR